MEKNIKMVERVNTGGVKTFIYPKESKESLERYEDCETWKKDDRLREVVEEMNKKSIIKKIISFFKRE